MKLLLPLGLALACAAPAIAQDSADLDAGKSVFAKCSACHDLSDEPRNRMGPYLTGVVGRPAASVEGFSYSQGMQTARDGGLVWTPETLDAFLSGPRAYVPGTKMPETAAVKDETDRANLIAYLQSASPDFDPESQKSTYAPPEGEAAGAAGAQESPAQ